MVEQVYRAKDGTVWNTATAAKAREEFICIKEQLDKQWDASFKYSSSWDVDFTNAYEWFNKFTDAVNQLRKLERKMDVSSRS